MSYNSRVDQLPWLSRKKKKKNNKKVQKRFKKRFSATFRERRTEKAYDGLAIVGREGGRGSGTGVTDAGRNQLVCEDQTLFISKMEGLVGL
jgi:hypothetical protein